MVREDTVLKRHHIAATGTDKSLHLIHPMGREELHVSEALILRPERHLACHAPEGRDHNGRGDVKSQQHRLELAHRHRRGAEFVFNPNGQSRF